MTEKRFENRLDKSNVKFNTLNPVWDNEKETGLNVFEMIDELNKLSDENEVLKSVNMEYEDALGRLEEENEQLKKALFFYLDIVLTESLTDFDKWCNLLFNCNYEEAKRKYGDFEYKEWWESE